MRILSFIEENNNLKPIEIEIALWPGLPQIHFLGLPDAHLKESALRIKSALKASGFRFPVAQQIVVNLRPTHIKKTSKGIEYAVALGYLIKSGQVHFEIPKNAFVYGELTLNGEVFEPETQALVPHSDLILISGQGAKGLKCEKWKIKSLQDLNSEAFEFSKELSLESETQVLRPIEELNLTYSKKEARFLEILALGGHHALLAGPAGSGKSTVARSVRAFMAAPSSKELDQIRIHHAEEKWRPLVAPHSGSTSISILGGGADSKPGDLAKSHLGILLLEELLEFDRLSIEGLRSPFDQQKIRVGRLKAAVEYPFETQVIATTNLCPCGKLSPDFSKQRRCRFSLSRCQSYSQRLSGPMLDRFQILHFSEPDHLRQVRSDEILESVDRARTFFNFSSSARPHREVSTDYVESHLQPGLKLAQFPFVFESERRKRALLRVALTIANLELSDHIGVSHLDEAAELTLAPFQRLERLFD